MIWSPNFYRRQSVLRHSFKRSWKILEIVLVRRKNFYHFWKSQVDFDMMPLVWSKAAVGDIDPNLELSAVPIPGSSRSFHRKTDTPS